MKRKMLTVLAYLLVMFSFTGLSIGAEEACINCHRNISPGQVADWESSRHSKEDVTCSVCHGDRHTGAKDAKLVQLPGEHVWGHVP